MDINPKRYDGGEMKKIKQKQPVCEAKSGKQKLFQLSLTTGQFIASAEKMAKILKYNISLEVVQSS